MRLTYAVFVALPFAIVGCNQNTALGNDREEQIDAVPTPAPIMGAVAALRNVDTALIKPQTMSQADIAAIGGLAGKCAIRLTEVAFPSLVIGEGQSAIIKLNGKLIPLAASGENRYADGGLSVILEPNDDEGDAGLQSVDMIVIPPGAEDEIGYSGFIDCSHREES